MAKKATTKRIHSSAAKEPNHETNDKQRVGRILTTESKRLRRIAGRRTTSDAKRAFNEAAALVASLARGK